jgi:hypothetical protein
MSVGQSTLAEVWLLFQRLFKAYRPGQVQI